MQVKKIAKFTIIASNSHFNVLVAIAVVNPNLQGWGIQCKDLEQFHWPGLSKILCIWEYGNPARETYIEFSILENVCLMLL